MSGHAQYDFFSKKLSSEGKIPENIKIVDVPIINATEETLKGYCEIVKKYHNTKVINIKWPKKSGRPIDENTGDQAISAEGIFEFNYGDNFCYAINNSVINGKYITGIINKDCTEIYTREANYHPCGGQIVYPYHLGGEPFIMLLSKAGDDITPEDFVAFYCDGTFGVQILPNVWHQPAFPMCNNVEFINKQCSVHACVSIDTINEFDTLLRINIANLNTIREPE